MYCLFMEGSQLFTCFASQTQWQTPSLSFQKNIPSVVHFYPNRWSMLVLSEPSQGGKCERKKEKWFTYGVTWAHRKTQFVFAMGNTHNGKKVYCLLQATVNTFLFVCRHTGKRLATQDWSGAYLLLASVQWNFGAAVLLCIKCHEYSFMTRVDTQTKISPNFKL